MQGCRVPRTDASAEVCAEIGHLVDALVEVALRVNPWCASAYIRLGADAIDAASARLTAG